MVFENTEDTALLIINGHQHIKNKKVEGSRIGQVYVLISVQSEFRLNPRQIQP